MKYLKLNNLSTKRVECTCHIGKENPMCKCGCRKKCLVHLYEHGTLVALKRNPKHKYLVHSVNYIHQSVHLISEKDAFWDEAYVSLCDIFPVGDGIDRAIRRIK